MLWYHLVELLGCAQVCTTAYYPISNVMVERFHRQLKGVFKAYPNSTQWRTAIKQDLLCSILDRSCVLVY